MSNRKKENGKVKAMSDTLKNSFLETTGLQKLINLVITKQVQFPNLRNINRICLLKLSPNYAIRPTNLFFKEKLLIFS